jgi:hypothetical protein
MIHMITYKQIKISSLIWFDSHQRRNMLAIQRIRFLYWHLLKKVWLYLYRLSKVMVHFHHTLQSHFLGYRFYSINLQENH